MMQKSTLYSSVLKNIQIVQIIFLSSTGIGAEKSKFRSANQKMTQHFFRSHANVLANKILRTTTANGIQFAGKWRASPPGTLGIYYLPVINKHNNLRSYFLLFNFYYHENARPCTWIVCE